MHSIIQNLETEPAVWYTHTHTHTHHRFKIKLPNPDQAHDKISVNHYE